MVFKRNGLFVLRKGEGDGKKQIFCPNCGSKNEEGMNYCTKCGTPLSGNVSLSEKKEKIRGYAIIAFVLAGILLKAGIFRFLRLAAHMN